LESYSQLLDTLAWKHRVWSEAAREVGPMPVLYTFAPRMNVRLY
jgi:hypothetical protein